jgi:hypothetical protein
MLSEEEYRNLVANKAQERVPIRRLPDGRQLWLYPMMFTHKLCLGPADNALWFDDSWCYPTREAGMQALETWDPLNPETLEPDGWHRHPRTGRRRPDGDPTQEYVSD